MENKDIMKKHYDIAIAGFWYGANYGSLLNGYATYRIFKGLGKDVLMINKPNASKSDIEITEGHNVDFIKRYYDSADISPLLSYEQLGELNEICDCFCAGSDQIWNYHLSFMGAMYLPFVNDDKKLISFATSFGNSEHSIPNDVEECIGEYLGRYSAISVREQFSADILRKRYCLRGDVVFEPVFCIDKNIYDELAEKSDFFEKDPYLLTYILDPTPQKCEAIKWYAERSRLKIISIPDGTRWEWKKKKHLFTLPNVLENVHAEDFLKAFQGASYVITDSFHGTTFSIIFRKSFISISNYKRGHERFLDLLSRLKLMDRLVMDTQNIPLDKKYLNPIDYVETNNVIAKERKSAIQWLKNAIEVPKDIMSSIILPKNITNTFDKNICTGCGACAVICPVQAITMKENEDGFLTPTVDNEKCTYCGLCFNKCPSQSPSYKNESPQCYAMMANDKIRKVSSSGGMFSVVAEYILNQGGCVCGAAFKDDFSVEHIVIDNISQLDRLRGSKYIQSETGKVFPKVKQLLEDDKFVLFTGMPCQVAGLYAYLGKDYPKLYTIDLLCHGITSFKVFEKYRKDVFVEKQLSELYFKSKEPWGWHAGVNACFGDGTKYEQPLEKDPYFIAYLNGISKSKVCETCKFNKIPRQGDITIGDFWKVREFEDALDDNKGTSVVLVNNDKAKRMLEILRNDMQLLKEAPLQIAIKGNRCIEHPYSLNKNRDVFFQYLHKIPFDALATGCRDNRLYEKMHMHLYNNIPAEDREFYFIAKITAENSNGRGIVTWIRSGTFERILKKYFGLSVVFGVSMRKEALKDNYILDYSILKGKAKEYYLVSLDRNYDEETYRQLNSFGYHETRDFIFRMKKPVVLEKYDLSKGNYYDAYGNSIEGFNTVIGKVIFRGFNNHIVLGKNISTAGNLNFDFAANGYVEVGDETRFNAVNKFEFKGYNGCSTITIGKRCRFTNALWRLYGDAHNTSVVINDSCTFESNLEIHPNGGKKVIIGKDCMFSYDINLWAGDGHAIFDVNTAERINDTGKSAPPKNSLVIGEHVWVGKNAYIMSGTNVGNGSIIGACSSVKGSFPNNCSIAGNPAKQLRTDIAWSRNGYADRLEQCGGTEYAVLTSSAKAPISGLNVLVVGGTRFMGICLVKELLAKGNKVTIATRGYQHDVFGLHVDRIKMDVTNPESVKEALDGKFYDIVFDNLAYCSENVNNILSCVKCGKYVQLSSIAVYANRIPDMKEELFEPRTILLEMCNMSIDYGKGKRQAEAMAYQKYSDIPIVSVRIPYVTKTERLYYYCKNVITQTPMKIEDSSRGFTFIRDTEVGKFLLWIAAQPFTGAINLASEGMVTVKMILDYIEEKTGKKAVIDTVNGMPAPFIERTFSLNMDNAKRLGYRTSNINDWFWRLMDEYIAKALRETK